MKKLKTLLVGPVLNRSGYGRMSDDFALALLENTNLDLQIAQTGWGSMSTRQKPESTDKLISERLIREPLKERPDLFVSVAIPNHVKPEGKFNVNISCIVEVDRAKDDLVQGLNKYNLSIVTSEYAKSVLLNSKVKPQIPIEVLYLGADTSIFRPDAPLQPFVNAELNKIPEEKCFLFVGQTTGGGMFQDRKDADTLMITFLETFKNIPNPPALILKTSCTNFGNFDRNGMLDKIRRARQMVQGPGNYPSIYLLHGELTELEMASLYNHPKIAAHISFTHGESFGLPLLEGCLSGKPVFVSNYSSQKEFITNPLFLLDGDIKEIPADVESEFCGKGSRWFFIDKIKASERLLDFWLNPLPYNQAALELAKQNAEKFSITKLPYRLNKILSRYI